MTTNRSKLIFGFLIFSLSIVLITIIYLRIDKKVNNKNIVLDCNKKLECKISGLSTKYQVSNISMQIEVSNNAIIKEVNVDKKWQGDGENGRIEIYTDENKTGVFPIANFKISKKQKNNKKIEIIIDSVYFYDEKFEEHKINKITKKI